MRLKSYVRNKAQPEGSIAEGYSADECLTFFSHYLSHKETLFNRPRRNYDVADGETIYSVLVDDILERNTSKLKIVELLLKPKEKSIIVHLLKFWS